MSKEERRAGRGISAGCTACGEKTGCESPAVDSRSASGGTEEFVPTRHIEKAVRQSVQPGDVVDGVQRSQDFGVRRPELLPAEAQQHRAPPLALSGGTAFLDGHLVEAGFFHAMHSLKKASNRVRAIPHAHEDASYRPEFGADLRRHFLPDPLIHAPHHTPEA